MYRMVLLSFVAVLCFSSVAIGAETETLPAFLIRSDVFEQTLKEGPKRALYGVVYISFLAVQELLENDHKNNDFVYEKIHLFQPEGNEWGIAVEITGRRIKSPSSWQQLGDDRLTVLIEFERYLSQLDEKGRNNLSTIILQEIVIRRGNNNKPIFPKDQKPQPPPAPPAPPKLRDPPTINQPTKSSRPKNAARPRGAPFPFKL